MKNNNLKKTLLLVIINGLVFSILLSNPNDDHKNLSKDEIIESNFQNEIQQEIRLENIVAINMGSTIAYLSNNIVSSISCKEKKQYKYYG